MAILKIYNDIVAECDKLILKEVGMNGTTYTDIREFIDSIPEDDPDIDIRLYCDGGNCVEGWSIYDALRQTNKRISATIEGKCSSIATIILLAAPVERRYAYRNASLCIHVPAIGAYKLPDVRLTPDVLMQQSESLRALAVQLEGESGKLLDLYEQRTKADRQSLAALMAQDIYIDMKTAVELGFVGSILPETTDKKVIMFNKKESTMPKVEVSAEAAKRICDLFQVENIEDIKDLKILDQVITSANGETFTVVREEGDPQVGDEAWPDGDFVMEDGTHVIIEDNVIVSISEPSTEGEPPAGEELTPEQQAAIIADLRAQIADFTEQAAKKDEEITALKEANAQMEALKEQLTAKETEIENLKGTQPTEEQTAIIEIVAKAGGKEWLDKVTNMRSTFSMKNRKFAAHKEPGSPAPEGETKTQRMIREAKEANARKRNGGVDKKED